MKKTSTFSCSIENMYTVVRMAWSYCLAEIDSFSAAYPFYTLKYVNDAIDTAKKAQAMLNQEERNAITKQDRQNLMTSATDCLANWQMLKTYILNGYPKATALINLQAAGLKYYAKAAKMNWSAMRSLLKVSNSFLANNSADLIDRLIMPDTFATQYAADTATCSKDNNDFLDAEVNKSSETKDKQAKDDAIYKAAIIMMKNGQKIYAGNAAMKEKFVFQQLLATAKKNNQAGLKGLVLSENQLPVAEVTVMNSNGKYTTVTDAKGRFHIAGMEAGDYLIFIEKAGYQTIELPVTLKPGMTGRLNPVLIPIAGMLKVA